MKAPPLEVVLGSTLIAGSSGFAIGCLHFQMGALCQPGAAEHRVTAMIIFAMLLFSILGSTAARISMTALIAAGALIMLNSGQMGLLDGTLHSPSSKLIFILLLGILPLWTPAANSWFKRPGRVSFVHSHALRGAAPSAPPPDRHVAEELRKDFYMHSTVMLRGDQQLLGSGRQELRRREVSQ
jgi:hypothetical protein